MSTTINPTERIRLEPFDLLVCLALLIGILLAFWPSLYGYFVSDDYLLIETARSIQNPWQPFTGNWLLQQGEGGWYRPMVLLSWLLDSSLWDLNPVGYHLSNMLVHLVVSIQCYFLALILARRRVAAGVAAAVFALHPVHTEAVAWISGRTDLWCAAFGFGAVLAFLRLRRQHTRGTALAVPILLALSILSKEQGYAFFCVIVALELVGPQVRMDQLDPELRLRRMLSPLLVVLALIAVRWMTIGGLGGYGAKTHLAFGGRVLIYLRTYFQWLVEPFRVAGYQGGRWTLVYSAVAMLALLGLFPRQTRWGVLWMALTLWPALTLCRAQYLYIPSFGFGLLIGSGLDPDHDDRLIRQIHPQVVRWIVAVTLLLFYILAARHQSRFWTHTGGVAKGILQVARSSHPNLPEGARVDLFPPPKNQNITVATFQNGWGSALRLFLERPDLTGITFAGYEAWEVSLNEDPPPGGSAALEVRNGMIYDRSDEIESRFGPIRNRVPLEGVIRVGPTEPVTRIQIPDTRAGELHVISAASSAVSLGDGVRLATLRVMDREGRWDSFPIRLGSETAEWALERPDVKAMARHRKPRVAVSWIPEPRARHVYAGHAYRAVFRLDEPRIIRAMELRLEESAEVKRAGASLEVRDIYLVTPVEPTREEDHGDREEP